MKSFCLLLLMMFYSFTSTAKPKAARSKVVDLGQLEVKGDVRRPSVEFYQLHAMKEDQRKELSEATFRDFEKALLSPARQKGKPHVSK